MCSAASVGDEVAVRPALTGEPGAGLALQGCATLCLTMPKLVQMSCLEGAYGLQLSLRLSHKTAGQDGVLHQSELHHRCIVCVSLAIPCMYTKICHAGCLLSCDNVLYPTFDQIIGRALYYDLWLFRQRNIKNRNAFCHFLSTSSGDTSGQMLASSSGVADIARFCAIVQKACPGLAQRWHHPPLQLATHVQRKISYVRRPAQESLRVCLRSVLRSLKPRRCWL